MEIIYAGRNRNGRSTIDRDVHHEPAGHESLMAPSAALQLVPTETPATVHDGLVAGQILAAGLRLTD